MPNPIYFVKFDNFVNGVKLELSQTKSVIYALIYLSVIKANEVWLLEQNLVMVNSACTGSPES